MDGLEKKIKSKRIRTVVISVLIIAAVIAGIFSLKIEKKPDTETQTKATATVVAASEKVENIEASLTADKTAVVSGSKVNLKVTVKGGKAPYKYHFLVYDQQGNEWYKLTDFQEKDSYDWNTGKTGKKTLFADVKDSSGQIIRTSVFVTVTETEDEAKQAEEEQKASELNSGAQANMPYADVNVPGISSSPGNAVDAQGQEQTTAASTTQQSTSTVTIKIICTELSNAPEQIPDNLKNYVPSNGIILNARSYQVSTGTSVYDVLNKACRENGIHMDHSDHPIYGTYVKAINYIYEKAAGNESGWKYKVNGKVPNVGCGSYRVSNGDEIVWYYTVSANG